jgi:homoserine dehydrogenase
MKAYKIVVLGAGGVGKSALVILSKRIDYLLEKMILTSLTTKDDSIHRKSLHGTL